MTVRSTWQISSPASAAISITISSIREEDAPSQRGSSSGNRRPMSPAARQPKTASIRACSNTSPSAWALTVSYTHLLADRMDYLSTGGGAFLEVLEGKKRPAVAALEDRTRS